MSSALALGILFALTAPAGAGTPTVESVLPRGAQRGSTLELTLRGKRLQLAEELLFDGPGLAAAGLQVHDKGQRVTLTLTVAPDCPLGEHGLRLRCRDGLSELCTFWVGALAELAEQEPNPFEQAQAVPLERTVVGLIDAEDVDCFAVEARAGQRITAEVEGLRLGTTGKVFDPALRVLDARRFQLAANDDAPLLGQDPLVSFVAPADGTYVLELRDASNHGGKQCHYRLHVGTFPRPLTALPLGGQPGEVLQLAFPGEVAGVDSATWTVPAGPEGLVEFWPRAGDAVAPSPLRLRRAPGVGVVEVEPNHRPQATQAPAAPFAVHGRLETPGDQDWFRFPARKGEQLRFRAWARELGSPLDPVLNVFERGGKHLKGNDDLKGRLDSELDWKAPADGEYELRVRDFLERGGPTHTYRIEVTPVAPAVSLALKTYGRNSQDRNAVVVPRGGRFATLVQVVREDTGGAVALTVDDLPAGIAAVQTAVCEPGTPWVPVVFEAAADAPLGARFASLRARHVDQPGLEGGLRQTIPISHGNPNNAVYWTRDQDRLAVAVTEPAPFRIELVAPQAPLARRGSAQLEVRVERDAGFENQVTLWLIVDPPGVGSAKGVKVGKEQASATIALNANDKAALGRWPLVVIAQAGHRGGPVWTSSQLAYLSVVESMLGLTLERAATPQGTTVEVLAKVEVPRPFTGEASARLFGLPEHCSAPALTLTAETRELRFPVQVGAQAKLGHHRHVFCQVVVPHEGQGVVHHLGDAELRVDPPPPAAAPAKPQPKPDAPPPQSRLDRLRAEHEAAKDGTP